MDMSKIKFKDEIELLLSNLDKIPDGFWLRTDGRKYQVIWFMDRQKPSVEQSYTFDEERFGITKDGRIIWGFDSGCSCPSPWSQSDYGDDNYNIKTWKEFEVESESAFDIGWDDECYNNLKDYLLLIKTNISAEDVLSTKNAEVRRYLIKKIGYEKIKQMTNAKIIHKDNTSELLDLEYNSQIERYVKVKDSSTDREYLLYVPSHIKTCKEGIAWTFDLKEEEYNPILET